MKILHIIPTLGAGGAEKLLVDTIEEMLKQGIPCDVIVLTKENNFFGESLSQLNITLHYSSYSNVYDPRNILFIKRIMQQGNYDCVHTHLFSAQLFTSIANALTKNKLPLVTTEHSTNNRRREKKIFYYLDSWMYKQYERIISITEGAKDALVSYLPYTENQTIVIYNGIQLKKFQQATTTKQLWDKLDDEVTVLMVAGMRTEKDHHTLIRASKLLPVNYRVVFVGDGALFDEVVNYASENGRKTILFLGARTDVPKIMKAADVFVLSSEWEGFGLVVVEAAAAGLPVVASDVAGLRDVVLSINGSLFEQGSAKMLAEKIIGVSIEKNKATQQQLEKYDITNMVSSYLKLYNDIMHFK
ncbi:hypothetical protein A0U40_08580 [[Bacillus] sp. KCTC 13219]|nr:hypothetical protein A0U40_08580 [[Bacillus] sp. KCTC 13219]